MPLWLIAIGALLFAPACGRVGYEEQELNLNLQKNVEHDGGTSDAAPDGGIDSYAANCSPDGALKNLCMGVDGGN